MKHEKEAAKKASESSSAFQVRFEDFAGAGRETSPPRLLAKPSIQHLTELSASSTDVAAVEDQARPKDVTDVALEFELVFE